MVSPFVEKEVIVSPGQTTTVDLRIRPLGSIVGFVENTSTDSLLKGVQIQLQDESGKVLEEKATGDDGSYRFSALSKGGYVVKLFLPRGYVVQGPAQQFVKIEGAQEVRANFQVYRHGAVEGRVLLEDGSPVSNAEVSLIDTTGAVLRSVRTGPDGVYSFPDVPVDKYKVRVSMPDTPGH